MINLLGEDKYRGIYSGFEDALSSDSPPSSNPALATETYFAKLAAYLVIKTKLPTLLENRHLQNFVDEYEKILRNSEPDLNQPDSILSDATSEQLCKEARSKDSSATHS